MKLLPENTTFTQVIKTEDFTCIEMQTGRPWTYQTDLYCLAATSHCLLFGNYMRVSNVSGRWFIASKLPRYTSNKHIINPEDSYLLCKQFLCYAFFVCYTGTLRKLLGNNFLQSC